MAMRPTLEEFTQRVESAVLNALDDTMSNITGKPFNGWQDEDLKTFLPGIRDHAKNLYDKIKIDV